MPTLGFPGGSVVKNLPAVQEIPGFAPCVGKITCRSNRLPTPVFLGFPGNSVGKESACNGGDLGSIPELEISPVGGHGNPLQYSSLRIPMDRGPGGLQSTGSQRVEHG